MCIAALWIYVMLCRLMAWGCRNMWLVGYIYSDVYIHECTSYWDLKFWRECNIIAASSELGNRERCGVCRKGEVSSVQGIGERNLRVVEMYKNFRVSGRAAAAQVAKHEWEIALRKLLTCNKSTELRNLCTLACRIKCQWEIDLKKTGLRWGQEWELVCLYVGSIGY